MAAHLSGMNAQGIALSQVTFTRHFLTQAAKKGFTAEQITAAIETPYKVTAVTRHPNQVRYCGAGIAVVMDQEQHTAITAYLDGVVTPMREDQRHDPAARTSRRLATAR